MPACVICGGGRDRKLFSRDGVDYLRCGGCGVLRAEPLPSGEELAALYGGDYYRSWGLGEGRNHEAVRSVKMRTYELRLRELKRRVAGGRLLDVGCAVGFSLEAAARAGWEVWGLEFNPHSAAIAEKKFPGRVHCGVLETAPYEEEWFDLATLFDLVEHLPDPVSGLRAAARFLKPGGFLSITTPDLDSLSARVQGSGWVHLKSREHLYAFNRRSMKAALDAAGLEFVEKKRAVKRLNVDYLRNQFNVYPAPLATPVFNALSALLPKTARELPLPVFAGEMLAIARKP